MTMDKKYKQPIRAIWIDVDQTLLDFDLCAKDALIDTFVWAGLDWKEEYFYSFLVENGKLWDRIEEGKLTRPELRKIRFGIMFNKWNLPLEKPVEFEERFSTTLHSNAHPMEGANDAVAWMVDAQYPLYIVSNGPALGQRNRLRIAGMLDLFTGVFTSEELGCAKPDPRFFEKALDQVRLDQNDPTILPSEILVIGDSWKADISCALAFGCPSIWFRRNRGFDPFTAPKDERVLEAHQWPEVLELLETHFTYPSK